MKNSQRPCQLIQENIAWGRRLSPEDQKHVLCCTSCSEIAAEFEDLDSLVREGIEPEIPYGFADKVVAQIGEEKRREDVHFSLRLPHIERIFFSKAVQWGLVGIGSVFGVIKIFRFFSGV